MQSIKTNVNIYQLPSIFNYQTISIMRLMMNLRSLVIGCQRLRMLENKELVNIENIKFSLLFYQMKSILPRKGDFRMRAHINPLNNAFFPFPPHHAYVNWKQHFPLHFGGSMQDNQQIYCNTETYPCIYQHPSQQGIRNIDFLDIGCGYGGLLFALAPHFPSKLIFGLQIRDKPVNYVAEKIRAYRTLYPSKYDNISVVRANTMKHLCHYFPKNTIEKIFICFPDPHFKTKNFKRRIISTGFLSEYAFLLKPRGRIYCITDVEELHHWHLQHLHNHTQFREVSDTSDPCINFMQNNTEESQKVTWKQGNKYWAVFQKIENV